MQTNVMDRINRLAAERSRLYRATGRRRLSGLTIRERVAAIDGELQVLWNLRRRERVGRLEGIDLLVHRVYEGVYGPGYDAAPIPVSDDAPSSHRAA